MILGMRNKDGFQIIAHRGFCRACPENTLPAFEAAARPGAAIELDVMATRDGHLVVHHDEATGRVFTLRTGEKRITDCTLVELQSAVPVQTGFEAIRFPMLEAVLAALPETRFYIELKTTDTDVRNRRNNRLEVLIADLIRQQHLYPRVTVISFSALSLRTIKRLDPAIRTGLDVSLQRLPRWVRSNPLFLQGLVWHARHRVGVDSLHPGYADTSAFLVQVAHRAGMSVLPWVSGQSREEEQALFPRLLGMGVDGLMTNAPDLLAEAVCNS